MFYVELTKISLIFTKYFLLSRALEDPMPFRLLISAFCLVRELTRAMLLSFRAAFRMDGFLMSDKCTDLVLKLIIPTQVAFNFCVCVGGGSDDVGVSRALTVLA